MEIGDGAGDAYQLFAVPCGDRQIGVVEHALHATQVADGAALGQCGGRSSPVNCCAVMA